MLRSLLVVFCVVTATESAKILAVFHTPAISHQQVFRPLTQELAKRGHQVVVITTDPAFDKDKAPDNLTEIDIHEVSYDLRRNLTERVFVSPIENVYEQLHFFLDMFHKVVLEPIKDDGIQNLIYKKNVTFDLLLIEACTRTALVYTHFFKAPTIVISSFGSFLGNFEVIGAPVHPLYPSAYRRRILNLTTWEKFLEISTFFFVNIVYQNREEIENKEIRDMFGQDVPTLSELSNNIDMLFLNMHPLWDSNRPVPPGVVYIGGIHFQPKKDLPRDLNEYLNSSMNGFIYVSFGTTASSKYIHADVVDAMVKTFSELPYNVLLKWDDDQLPGRNEKIRIAKWFPQADVLRHSNIKLFITQAGLQSTEEAIEAGVPLMGIPLLGDQWFNSERYIQFKIGVTLDIRSVKTSKFKDAIELVIKDESYRQNVLKLRDILHDQPQKPLDRAVWWAEYILRHKGASHLRSPTANISWMEYLQIDVIIVFFAAILTILTIVVLLVTVIIRIFVKIFIAIRTVCVRNKGNNFKKND